MAKMHKITPLNPGAMGGPGADVPIYPTFHIKETDLPAVKDKKIDDEYKIVLKVKQRAIRKLRAGDIEAEVEVREIGLANKESK